MSESFIDWEKKIAPATDYSKLTYDELLQLYKLNIQKIKRLNQEVKQLKKLLLGGKV